MTVNHPPRPTRGSWAFTLVELLAVIAIISLLIGILVPALSKARQQAKNTRVRATLKAIGDGLELFRNENPRDVRGEGYPPSTARDDPTEDGTSNTIFGAQWLVRYLMGKDLNGYVSPSTVPVQLRTNRTPGAEQKDWYAMSPTGDNPFAPLDRRGPYLNPDGVKIARPIDLPGMMGAPPLGPSSIQADERSLQQFVILDVFGFPILYYAANPFLANKPGAPLATYDGSQPGIYNFTDNVLFTGRCLSTTCDFPPWDFSESGATDPTQVHAISKFGTHPNNIPDRTSVTAEENRHTFPYYILNKNVFESTNGMTVVPYNRDSYILISAGQDGRYGTADDVTNFR